MKNSKAVGKYVIVKNLKFDDFMKDKNGEICIYDTLYDACVTCGMYEFENVLVMKVEFNHIENN